MRDAMQFMNSLSSNLVHKFGELILTWWFIGFHQPSISSSTSYSIWNPAKGTHSWSRVWLKLNNYLARVIHPIRSSPSNLRKSIRVPFFFCKELLALLQGKEDPLELLNHFTLAWMACTSSCTVMMILDRWSYLWSIHAQDQFSNLIKRA